MQWETSDKVMSGFGADRDSCALAEMSALPSSAGPALDKIFRHQAFDLSVERGRK